MPEKRFYLTTAIDYPNSRPHIGTAFEKIGADVQARYRRMEGYEVFFLMGNDENTIKVARKAAELGQDVKAYCDDMARQFQEVWRALDISYDCFIQTSAPFHHRGCQKFIQKVFDKGYIYKGTYEGWYCDGCESFKTEKDLEAGLCPIHKTPAVRRVEPCHFFALSRFQKQLLRFYDENPDFIQPESRRNEILALVKTELKDVNITRHDQKWGIQVPFDPEFTIWVWFDALLNYITAIGYGSDDAQFEKWWPADVHFIGKDITRFHCAVWPAMLMAAELPLPKKVFGHGFVNIKKEESGVVEKISKSLGNVIEPMEVVGKFSVDSFRYYFMRECPFPGDGEFSWERFREVFNGDLANNIGNLYSRVVTLITKNYGGCLEKTASTKPTPIGTNDVEALVQQIQRHIEACQYNQALDKIWRQILDPANQHADRNEPWKLVKTDKEAARKVLFDLAEPLRQTAILLKPFVPGSAKIIYESFNFQPAWEAVRCEDVWRHPGQKDDLRVTAALEVGKVKPLFPRIS
jgi:methionyl-tRNA synthetase